jgi:hypothetical protein
MTVVGRLREVRESVEGIELAQIEGSGGDRESRMIRVIGDGREMQTSRAAVIFPSQTRKIES